MFTSEAYSFRIDVSPDDLFFSSSLGKYRAVWRNDSRMSSEDGIFRNAAAIAGRYIHLIFYSSCPEKGTPMF